MLQPANVKLRKLYLRLVSLLQSPVLVGYRVPAGWLLLAWLSGGVSSLIRSYLR